ncbi:MAG: transcription termination factor NusA [Candidatus Fischerbacteria bacterium RBG_13_37_8]|uniref:Transcription termination/antitermination protein NusA n=1 Tax=Candidatus Fischerbacteria bacterium RBG_13_37_8 TaxID=1817863 RepID=A0A1F5VEG7_9BACT|nr:MAG: transcription termination factor NusA [Candidatus Fischerbacteria bacterium RBG_13_37_8]
MTKEIIFSIEHICKEKGLEFQYMVKAVEDAIATASKKYYRSRQNFVAHLNRDSGTVDLYVRKKIVEKVEDSQIEMSLEEAHAFDPEAEIGDEMEILYPSQHLGRIAAQAARQVIQQKMIDAEKQKIYQLYAPRVGEMISGTVKIIDRKGITLELPEAEAILPTYNQLQKEVYRKGDHVRSLIVKVYKYGHDPQVILSRNDAKFLAKLFEMEVQEVYDGIVEIKSVAREAGDRAKVAVCSKDQQVDPVGSCVGIKGSRIQSIINELHGEKIDIIEWSEDVKVFASNALKPAKIVDVEVINNEEKRLKVWVDESQLSLAIGKKGQNVRLASRLIGWRIDIGTKKVAESEKETPGLIDEFFAYLGQYPDIGKEAIELLKGAGYDAFVKIVKASPTDFMKIEGIDYQKAQKIKTVAKNFVKKTQKER